MNSALLKTEVNYFDEKALEFIKSQLDIPLELSSCHSATIGKYFMEDHFSAQGIIKLHQKKPNALGLSVPGMPIGSSGMEMEKNKKLLTLY